MSAKKYTIHWDIGSIYLLNSQASTSKKETIPYINQTCYISILRKKYIYNIEKYGNRT